VSKLWSSYFVYGFNLLLDLVYDVMHILPLCLFKKFVAKLKENCQKRKAKLSKALKKVAKRRPIDLGAHWLVHILECMVFRKLKSISFSSLCLHYVLKYLEFIKDEEICALSLLLIEICQLFFIRSRTFEWTHQSMIVARQCLVA
jgi:hypothetical protein